MLKSSRWRLAATALTTALFVAVFFWVGWSSGQGPAIWASLMLKVAEAGAALVTLRFTLRFFDLKAAFPFNDWIKEVRSNEDHLALAIYNGCRYLGSAFIVGWIFSS